MRVMHRLIAVVALAACSRARSATDVEACTLAFDKADPAAGAICKRAWDSTHDTTAAVLGAKCALMDNDYQALQAWVAVAPPNAEGARILHLWGEMQGARGNLDEAETALRRALALQRDVDPKRAWNTAVVLLTLVRNRRPASETIELAYAAWEQASRAALPIPRAMTAAALVEVLLDLGELKAAQLVVERIQPGDSAILRALSDGRLQVAQARFQVATAHFKDATAIHDEAEERAWGTSASIELLHANLQLGRMTEAAAALAMAEGFAKTNDVQSTDLSCKLAAARASFALADGKLDRAIVEADRGLALESRDAARVKLLGVRGEALARKGDWQHAEAAWREAADQIEAWRASIPLLHLRAGLVANHRRVLEAWLDSAARRGDASVAVDVVQRIIGRGLLDRLRDRASGTADPARAVHDVTDRLAIRKQLAATPRIASSHNLLETPHDLVAIMTGAERVWALRHTSGRWVIETVGDRAQIAKLVDAYRRDPDAKAVAEQLGGALFPPATLPAHGRPLTVVLDSDLADVPLAGLRTGGRFLVEHAPIVELLVPELLFAEPTQRSWSPAVAIGDPDGSLPAASREVAMVARAISATPAIGAQATRAAVIAAASARTLHIATHSSVEAGRAAFVLHGGVVTAYDIVKERVAPRLAVIATCRSQVDDDPEESLVAAFLAAGSSGVVGVKRAINDADGERLIAEFYAAGGDTNPTDALAIAQRNAIHSGRPPHAWAAFSFFGSGEWLKPEVRK